MCSMQRHKIYALILFFAVQRNYLEMDFKLFYQGGRVYVKNHRLWVFISTNVGNKK